MNNSFSTSFKALALVALLSNVSVSAMENIEQVKTIENAATTVAIEAKNAEAAAETVLKDALNSAEQLAIEAKDLVTPTPEVKPETYPYKTWKNLPSLEQILYCNRHQKD